MMTLMVMLQMMVIMIILILMLMRGCLLGCREAQPHDVR